MYLPLLGITPNVYLLVIAELEGLAGSTRDWIPLEEGADTVVKTRGR